MSPESTDVTIGKIALQLMIEAENLRAAAVKQAIVGLNLTNTIRIELQ